MTRRHAGGGYDEDRRRDDTGWLVGIIVALALLCIGYLIFAAQGEGPYNERYRHMQQCIKKLPFEVCESNWEKFNDQL